MAIPTFLVGVLPGYHVLGVAAPVVLTLLRMIQGLSVGGEYTTSIVFMVEHAPPGRRGLIGAMGGCGAVVGILLGSATGALLPRLMPADEAWRPGAGAFPSCSAWWSGCGFFSAEHLAEGPSAERRPLAGASRRFRLHGRCCSGSPGFRSSTPSAST